MLVTTPKQVESKSPERKIAKHSLRQIELSAIERFDLRIRNDWPSVAGFQVQYPRIPVSHHGTHQVALDLLVLFADTERTGGG